MCLVVCATYTLLCSILLLQFLDLSNVLLLSVLLRDLLIDEFLPLVVFGLALYVVISRLVIFGSFKICLIAKLTWSS
jgi:hypothetical protein